MMIQQVIPTGKKILIKQKKAKTKTASGLYLPEIAQKNEYKGVVVAKGQSVEEIKMGDIVQYTEHCLPTRMEHDGEEHLLIQEGDVFAIIVEIENV
jgi:chaperonin GroES